MDSIKEILNKNDFEGNKSSYDSIITALDLIYDSLEDKNKESMSGDNVDIIDESIYIIARHLVMSDNLSSAFKAFIVEFISLVEKWNEIYKSKKIKMSIKFLKDLNSFHKTTIKLIENYKFMVEEYRAINNFNPPSYKITEHYLNIMTDKFE